MKKTLLVLLAAALSLGTLSVSLSVPPSGMEGSPRLAMLGTPL